MSYTTDPPPRGYIHGTSPAEQERLAALNELLNRRSLAELNLCGGERILDVGCGLGQFARLLARTHQATVVGVERSPEQIARGVHLADEAGELDLLDVRPGMAEQLPLRPDEWGTFDVAHARFILEHVADPLAVVRGMVRAVRPGGRIVLMDDDHDLLQLHPPPFGLETLWQAYIRTYDRVGCDPFVGRRLPMLLQEAGARPIRTAAIFLGGCHGSPDFLGVVENLVGIFLGARELILSTGMLTVSQFEQTITHLRSWALQPGAALWYTLPWAEGVRPG